MSNVKEIFGTMVFNDAVMKARLPQETYEQLHQAMEHGHRLDLEVANVVASAMKDWAIEKGVTHYTHWFQPMTGVTAEKHDSFISPAPGGGVIMDFRGKELVRGEPDASSFPSGGLRATFEARGYTAWDPTSYAFIKDNVLCIPTAFCSYGGHALDKKTPLLRSMETVGRQAMRILRLFGNEDVRSVRTTVGPEQEYFLVDRDLYSRRKDLIFTGRTLFGAMPPKGQEMDDHYFGAIKPSVSAFMSELDDQLWKLGVLAKTEHNEAAPSQHELAPIFATANIATDHNQLTMELMTRTAGKHGMVCLLHEKPFAGVNGSGKHNNWSLSTDTGVNLLEPGETPYKDAQFLLFLCAVLKAVDDYQDLLRVAVASAGNDHRLGGYEAPPAVVSVFLGDELTEILDAIESGAPYGGKEKEQLKVGVHVLPRFPKDTTDRNRTSPFAFTGNKFEFRMVGSSASVSGANVVLNTAVAEVLRQFADELEAAGDFRTGIQTLIRRVIHDHKRIIFNGNGYDEAWLEEAARRGLLNLPTTPDALPHFIAEKNRELFERHGVFSREELMARHEIHIENYCKVIRLEARTMLGMAKKEILPAVSAYIHQLSRSVTSRQATGLNLRCAYETDTLCQLAALNDEAYARTLELEALLADAEALPTSMELARCYCDRILPAMNALRAPVDQMELITPDSHWPIPTYTQLLFSTK